jgi:hypothetical protein
MPWLRLCHPVANARNRSLLCASGASTTRFRLREARVREPICAEPDSRDLGVADPQRDVRLEHVHPFLIGGSLVGCRLSPVLRAPEGFQKGGGRASKASGVGATAERYGPPKGLLCGLARSVKGDDPNHWAMALVHQADATAISQIRGEPPATQQSRISP